MLKVLQHPNSLLKQKCESIEDITQDIKDLAGEMFITMKLNGGIGLAASQIGKLIQMIVIDTTKISDNGHNLVMLNPSYKISDNSIVENEEGCLSFKDKKYKVKRNGKITANWQDLNGKSHKQDFSGMTAVCIQHEIDHIRGITIADIGSLIVKSK